MGRHPFSANSEIPQPWEPTVLFCLVWDLHLSELLTFVFGPHLRMDGHELHHKKVTVFDGWVLPRP